MIVTPTCIIPEEGDPGPSLPRDCIGGIYPPIVATRASAEVTSPGVILVQVHVELPESMRAHDGAIASALQAEVRAALSCCGDCGGCAHDPTCAVLALPLSKGPA